MLPPDHLRETKKGEGRVLAEFLFAALSASAGSAATGETHSLSSPLALTHAAPMMAAPSPLTSDDFRIISANHTPSPAMTQSMNRLIGGIITYVRWPDTRAPAQRQLCVVGTPHLNEAPQPDLPGPATMTVSYRSVRDVAQMGHCDALYIGQLAVADRQRLISWVRDKPVLTMTDADPSCAYGSMFCLTARRQTVSFSVNLDAVGRGPLRVDPRVLRIGRDS